MLLVIDVGNTQTVVGLYDSGDRSHQLLDHWRMSTNAERTSDELLLLLRQLLETRDLDIRSDVRGVAVSSGVPSITYELRRMCERYLTIEPVVLGAGDQDRHVGPLRQPPRGGGGPHRQRGGRLRPVRRSRPSWWTSAPPPPST